MSAAALVHNLICMLQPFLEQCKKNPESVCRVWCSMHSKTKMNPAKQTLPNFWHDFQHAKVKQFLWPKNFLLFTCSNFSYFSFVCNLCRSYFYNSVKCASCIALCLCQPRSLPCAFYHAHVYVLAWLVPLNKRFQGVGRSSRCK